MPARHRCAQALAGGREKTWQPANHLSGRVVRAPVVAEPAVVPVPPATAPVEVPDARAAALVTVDGTEEEDGLAALPVLRDEVGIGQVEVEQVGVGDEPLGLDALQALAQLVATENTALLLLVGEVQLHLGQVDSDLPALLVLLDRPVGRLPVVGHERIGIEINLDVADGDDLRPSPVLEPCSECDSGLDRLVDQLLCDIGGNRAPVDVAAEHSHEGMRLLSADFLHGSLPFATVVADRLPKPMGLQLTIVFATAFEIPLFLALFFHEVKPRDFRCCKRYGKS